MADAHWVGVEQEFELFDCANNKLDFRSLFDSVAGDLSAALFRNRYEARPSPKGYVLSADVEEAEIATAPIELPGDKLDTIIPEVLRARADLIKRLKATDVTRVDGYSTHISISVSNDDAWALAREAMTTMIAPLMLLLSGPQSKGILVRPRFERLEICGEYVDEPDALLAATCFCYGALVCLQRTELPPDWPRFRPGNLKSSNHREGYTVSPNSYGEDIVKVGRDAKLQVTSGGTISAGRLLANWAAFLLPYLKPVLSERGIQTFLRQTTGTGKVLQEQTADRIKQVTTPDSVNIASPYAHRIAAIAEELPRAGYQVAFFDWTGVALRLPDGSGYLGLPITHVADFIQSVRQERVPEFLEGVTRSTTALTGIEQLALTRLYEDVNPEALGNSAEGLGGKKKKIIATSVPTDITVGTPGIYDVLYVCHVTVTVAEKKLCLNEEGSATAQTIPAGPVITWVLPPGLRALSGQGTHTIKYKAIRGGCHTVKCIAFSDCEGEDTVVVPEMGLMTGDEEPVLCVGIAGHAPGIRLSSPVAAGSYKETVAAVKSGGSDMETYSAEFQVEGTLVDPLGYKGANLTIELSDGLQTGSTSIPVNEDTGEFAFTVTATGTGLKRIIIRAKGVTGATGIGILSGQLTVARQFRDTIMQLIGNVAAAYARDEDDTRQMILGDGSGSAPPSVPLTQAELDRRRAQLRRDLSEVDEDARNTRTSKLDNMEFNWSTGYTDMSDTLSEKSRYKLSAIDCMPELGPTADLLDDTFELNSVVTALISVDPEAFVPVPGGHDGEDVPDVPGTILQDIPRAIEDDFIIMAYRSCRAPVGAPYRVTVEGQTFALINQPNEQRFNPRPPPGGGSGSSGSGGSGTSGPVVVGGGARYETQVRKKAARLEAAIHGKCENVRHFEWRVVYGPDLNGVEIETEGGFQEICKFTGEVPGLYLIEARAITDHDNPLAASVFEVEVLDVHLSFNAPDLEEIQDETATEFWVSVDNGEQLLVKSRVALSSDSRMVPSKLLRAEYELRWAGMEVGGAGGTRAVTDVNSNKSRFYRIGTRAGASIFVSGYMMELTLTDDKGERHIYDLSGASFDDTLGTVFIRQGKPDRVTLRILSSGVALPNVTERVLQPFDVAEEYQYENVDDIRQSAMSLEEFEIGNSEHMLFKFEAKDRHGNPVAEDTEVGFRSFGSGVILTQGGNEDPNHFFKFDSGGKVTMGYRTPQKTLNQSLVVTNIDDKVYFIGNPMASLTFVALSDASNITTDINGKTVNVHELAGAAYAEIEVLGPGGRGTNARFRIHARIAGGSIRQREGDIWTPDLETVTDADGKLRLYFNPMPHSPDGTVPLGARNVWGETNLFISVGALKDTFKVNFDIVASVRRVPRLELPMMPMVQQENLNWLPRPRDINPAGAPQLAPGELQGDAGQEILIELKEHVEFRPYGRFEFNSPVTGLWNPPATNSAPRDRKYNPPIPIEIKGRNQSSILAAAAGHAVVAIPPAPSPNSGNVLKLAYSIPAALAGLDYSASVPGSFGFRINFAVYLDGNQEDCDILKVVGSDPNNVPLESRGALTVRFTSQSMPPTLVVEYNAAGCPARAAIRMMPIPRRVPLNAWIQLELTVMPEFSNDRVVVDASFAGPGFSRSVQRNGENFNFLAGNIYFVQLAMPDDGEVFIDGLEYLIPQNGSLHMRRDDGLDTIWHTERLTGDRAMPPLVNEERANATRPTFSASLEPHAEMTVAYCDKLQFERVRIGAADRDLAMAAAYTEDTILSFIVGDSQTVPGMGADLVAGLVGWGDARDIAKNLAFLWPGGRDPNWNEFTLAVCGLALDVAQIFSAGAAAAPNALIGCIKVMMKRLEPFIDFFPQAARIASELADLARKVLIEMRGARIAQGTTIVITINDLRQMVPAGLVDFLFKDLNEDHLKTFVEFAKSVTPSFNPLAVMTPTAISDAYNHIANIQENAGRVQEMTEVVELLMARIDLLAWFFNPVFKNIDGISDVGSAASKIMDHLGTMNPKESKDITERFKDLLDAAGDWDSKKFLRDRAGSAVDDLTTNRKVIGETFEIIGKALQDHGDMFNDPRVLKGFMAFVGVSGPQNAAMLLTGLNLASTNSRARLQRMMRFCDYASELITEVGTRRGRTPAQQRQDMHRVWHGLAGRFGVTDASPLGRRVNRNARDGAEAELLAIAAFGRGRLARQSGQTGIQHFNPLKKGGQQLMDFFGEFFGSGRAAIEVKSLSGNAESVKKGITRILDQYEDWVNQGFTIGQEVKQFNYAVHFHGFEATEKLRLLEDAFEARYLELLDLHNRFPTRHGKPPPVDIFPLDGMDLPA